MDFTFSNSSLIEKYFLAWSNYDLDLLENIFSDGAQYVILPRKKTLVGIDSIKEYWIRNSKRQSRLKLSWGNIVNNNDSVFTDFIAEFDDITISEHMIIAGTICMLLECNKINLLSEYYTKIELKLSDVFYDD